jgi:hypothetical protein
MDNILNEFMKMSNDNMVNVYVTFFNVILQTGIVPESWTNGVIIPIYKKKGNELDPNNYRGITLLSCFSKLFTACVNHRLTEYVDKEGLLGEEQAGFRQGYAATDHIFSLTCLIELYLMTKKRLYVAFVDYQKAFDSVERYLLWIKLLSYNINGKVLNVVRNLYEKAKSCVMTKNVTSELFNCSIGVRQGENLSPLLFALFVNDMSAHLSKFYSGLGHVSDQAKHIFHDDTIEVYLRLYLLLYADDTVILAESSEELQCALDGLHDYCQYWNLTVNTSKTKIVIFSRGKIRKIPMLKIGNDVVDVIFDYAYLGIVFNYNGKFKKAKSKLVDMANKAMFSLIRKIRSLSLPVDMSLDLFDKLVVPILL